MSSANQPLVIAGRMFRSRLILGTGKFSSPETMREALAASGAEMVTVALRRADLSGKKDPFANILEFIDREPVFAAAQHQRRDECPRGGSVGAPGGRRRVCPNG